MTAQSSNQFATVNVSGDFAELVRFVMRQTGWDVDAAMAHLVRYMNRAMENNHIVEVDDTRIEGNTVGVQVVKNTITAYEFKVGDVVRVTVPLSEEDGYDEGDTLKLFGVVNGFAPQGVGVTLTDRSVEAAKGYDTHVNKDDLWSVESVEAV